MPWETTEWFLREWDHGAEWCSRLQHLQSCQTHFVARLRGVIRHVLSHTDAYGIFRPDLHVRTSKRSRILKILVFPCKDLTPAAFQNQTTPTTGYSLPCSIMSCPHATRTFYLGFYFFTASCRSDKCSRGASQHQRFHTDGRLPWPKVVEKIAHLPADSKRCCAIRRPTQAFSSGCPKSISAQF